MVCGDTRGLAFFTKHILLSIFTQWRKPSIKFKQRDHLSQKIRESNTVRKSESSTDLERSDRWSSTGGSNGRQRQQGQEPILSEIWLSWGVRWPIVLAVSVTYKHSIQCSAFFCPNLFSFQVLILTKLNNFLNTYL